MTSAIPTTVTTASTATSKPTTAGKQNKYQQFKCCLNAKSKRPSQAHPDAESCDITEKPITSVPDGPCGQHTAMADLEEVQAPGKGHHR